MTAAPAAGEIRGSRHGETYWTESGCAYLGCPPPDICLPPDPGTSAALAEGFCPQCQDPLGGNPRNWCVRCEIRWRFRDRPG